MIEVQPIKKNKSDPLAQAAQIGQLVMQMKGNKNGQPAPADNGPMTRRLQALQQQQPAWQQEPY